MKALKICNFQSIRMSRESFHMISTYFRVPIRRHGTFIRHTSFIRPNTFPKRWAVSYNWISMSNWSTFRYKFVCINLHLLYRPRHPCLLFGTIHEASGDPCLIFRTPLLIGTREYCIEGSLSSIRKRLLNIYFPQFGWRREAETWKEKYYGERHFLFISTNLVFSLLLHNNIPRGF